MPDRIWTREELTLIRTATKCMIDLNRKGLRRDIDLRTTEMIYDLANTALSLLEGPEAESVEKEVSGE